MAKDKVTSEAKKNQAAIIKEFKNRPIQDRVKSVQGDMYRVADSLVFIKKMIYEANYQTFIDDLVPPMLEERAAWIRERAGQLYLDLGVEPPGD